MGGALDVDSSRGRHPRSHGAVRLPSRSAGSVSGCKLRLAEILRQSGAGARRGCAMKAANKLKASRGLVAGFWISTALFALQMGFTAYAQLRLPQVAAAFAHLGFPNYFRIELSWLKFAGILVLLLPAPDRLKEWAYAGFAITLGSALIAHLSVGDDASAWSWPAGT